MHQGIACCHSNISASTPENFPKSSPNFSINWLHEEFYTTVACAPLLITVHSRVRIKLTDVPLNSFTPASNRCRCRPLAEQEDDFLNQFNLGIHPYIYETFLSIYFIMFSCYLVDYPKCVCQMNP